MKKADRKTIMRNIVTLSKDIDFVSVTQHLLAGGIFEIHHIEKFDAKPSKREKNMALLMDIVTRGPRAFTSLVGSLIEADQEYLAKLLGYSASGPSQGRMGQAQATTAHVNRPAPFGQPTQPQVWPANDGHGDYSSTQMDALGSYPQAMMESNGVYKMTSDPRGIAVIINNKNFYNNPDLEERTGTDVDCRNLEYMFRQLKFEVSVHNNCTAAGIKKIIEQQRKKDHSSFNCFILAILSHGKKGDAIYGTDSNLVTLEYIMDQFGANQCPSLSGKPKLFFVQACRGGKYDKGVPVLAANGAETFQEPAGDNCPLMDDENLAQMEEDSPDNPASNRKKMPCQSDMLLSYSTVPGYKAWRNRSKGSWYIQALTEIINQNSREEDLLSMLTKINNKVAQDFTTHCVNHYKQIPAFTSALSKDFKFFPEQ